MSRGVKDLRQMVCLSRQSVEHETGRENSTSDEESEEPLIRTSLTPFRASGDSSMPVKSHDISNGDREASDGSHCSKKRHPRTNATGKTIVGGKHSSYDNPTPFSDCDNQFVQSLLKTKPLPGVGIECWGTVSVEPGSSSPQSASRIVDRVTGSTQCSLKTPAATLNTAVFTEILKHFNRNVVLNWLEQVKCSIGDMSDWCHSKENFVHFAHSWLSLLSEQTRNELTELEFSVLRDNILSTIRDKSPPVSLFDSFLSILLHEFSAGLLVGQQGATFFLDYMDGLTSSPARRTTILTDVHCSQSSVKSQYYECILAIRSFAIVSIWSAILDHYRNKEDYLHTGRDSNVSRPSTTQSSKSVAARPKSGHPKSACLPAAESEAIDHSELSKDRAYQAIRLGFTDVIQFMLDTNRISPDVRDSSNRTLVFYAAANHQPAVLRFLLLKTDCCLYVNLAADSGNTPLHAAANRGDAAVIRELLKARDIKVDARNHLCDNATPLHLAAMHGHKDIVQLLLNAGANPSKTMGANKTAADIARDFDRRDIVDLLQLPANTRRSSNSATVDI